MISNISALAAEYQLFFKTLMLLPAISTAKEVISYLTVFSEYLTNYIVSLKCNEVKKRTNETRRRFLTKDMHKLISHLGLSYILSKVTWVFDSINDTWLCSWFLVIWFDVFKWVLTQSTTFLARKSRSFLCKTFYLRIWTLLNTFSSKVKYPIIKLTTKRVHIMKDKRSWNNLIYSWLWSEMYPRYAVIVIYIWFLISTSYLHFHNILEVKPLIDYKWFYTDTTPPLPVHILLTPLS